MDKDRKMTALKELQGHIWDSAYKTGEIKGFVYDDVFLAFNEWKSNDIPVYIYSSGSVLAQKLLFGHSNQQPADLLPFLSGHYDTVFPGSKVEATSYEKIVQDINVNSSDVLFATDNILEAEAAKQAGVQAVLAIRPRNKELPEKHVFATVTSFDQLL
jgi:2,3-diketo-5-methylthio-1-phosphopentane phosphatase